jgi:hypothetical protein
MSQLAVRAKKTKRKRRKVKVKKIRDPISNNNQQNLKNSSSGVECPISFKARLSQGLELIPTNNSNGKH